jgi:hypothetical protein
VDWLDACFALKVVGDVLVVFLWHKQQEIHFCIITGEHKKLKKMPRAPHLGLELTSDHAGPQKPDPSRETFPLMRFSHFSVSVSMIQ